MAILRDNWIIVAIAVAVVAALVVLIWLWWRVPKWQMQDRIFKSEKERADAEDNFRKTLGQALGGAAVLIGAGAAYLQFLQQQQTATQQIIAQQKIASDQIGAQQQVSEVSRKASEDLLISNQVSKGFEQLASDKVPMRLGGIYALEGVMNASAQYYQPLLEALCAFVRDGTVGKTGERGPANDIQAVLTVIGRRNNGGNVDLRFANLRAADLQGANLSGANLFQANLTFAALDSANLTGTSLIGADLTDAHLVGANLTNASLRGEVYFSLREHHSVAANLIGANLRDVNLSGVDLSLINLTGADLSGAKLGGVDLSQAQLDRACGSHVTMPDGQVRDLKPCPDSK
jgi:hypothetical protein